MIKNMVRVTVSFILLAICICAQTNNQPLAVRQQKISHYVETAFFIFDKQCFDNHFSKFSFAAPLECYSFTLSKILGYALVASSMFIRVPQILIILKQRSVAGLSFFGNNQELLMTCLTVGFSIYSKLSFSVYGDSAFIGVQNFIILILFLIYSKQQNKAKMFFQFSLICIVSALSIFQYFPPEVQQASVWLTLVTFILARGAQILTNFDNKSTGNLAFTSILLMFFGCLIRVFNVLVEASDQFGLLMNYLVPAFMNGYLLLQFWMYKDNKVKEE